MRGGRCTGALIVALAAAGLAGLVSPAMAQAVEAQAKSLPETIMPWMGMVGLTISIAGNIWLWLTSRSKDNAETLRDHEKRIQRIEDEMEHLPDREAAHSLEKSMVELAGRLDVLTERLRPIDSITTRLQEFLLEQARK